MITPNVWSTGPIAITEPAGGIGGAVTWQLIAPATGDVEFTGGVDSAGETEVVFTPKGASPATYTVVLLDAIGGLVLRYTSALAVTTAPPPEVPDGVALTWVDEWGAVRFTAGGMTDTQTVKIIGPGHVLKPIRGYEGADWHAGSDAGYGYAFEAPLGVDVAFAVVDIKAKTWSGQPYTTIATPDGRAWLRDLYQPLLSVEVAVVSTGTEEKAGRQTVHKVAGRARPIVRWDVREARSGTITLKVENVYTGLWTTTYRDRLERLLDTGRPLLLSMCHSKGFPACYMVVAASRFTRVSGRARWACELDYLEVDNPIGIEVAVPVEVTWAEAMQIPPAAKWSDWATTTWLDIATRTSP